MSLLTVGCAMDRARAMARCGVPAFAIVRIWFTMVSGVGGRAVRLGWLCFTGWGEVCLRRFPLA